MSEMIYRPKTDDRHFEGKKVLKVDFKGIPCDAIVIDVEELPGLESKGWFGDPNAMIKPKRKAKPNDSSNGSD